VFRDTVHTKHSQHDNGVVIRSFLSSHSLSARNSIRLDVQYATSLPRYAVPRIIG